MADLFQKDVRTINEHIRNIFAEGELLPESVIRNFRITAADGKTYDTQHYNLDVVISVGYRVKSHRGTQFRIWATQRLREYIVKGFTLDDERLKQAGGGNYFDELLARIPDIRSSDKVFRRRVLDIYATSIDYDPSTEMSRRFFLQIVQNKMHWAAHGHTAAEIIAARTTKTVSLSPLSPYSLPVIALKLEEAFGLKDINDLPISFDIAWYEQKAVAVLLALLYLGVKGMRLGPTLPGFLSPNVAKVLVDKFAITPIRTAEEDIAVMTAGKERIAEFRPNGMTRPDTPVGRVMFSALSQW